MSTKAGRYAALVDEDAAAATNYSHAGIITSPKVREFLHLMSTNPRFNRKKLADDLQVTRQTVHSWIRKVRHNQPIRPRGRAAKFGSDPTTAIRVRLPLSTARMLVPEAGENWDSLASEKLRAAIEGLVVRRWGAGDAAGPQAAR